MQGAPIRRPWRPGRLPCRRQRRGSHATARAAATRQSPRQTRPMASSAQQLSQQVPPCRAYFPEPAAMQSVQGSAGWSVADVVAANQVNGDCSATLVAALARIPVGPSNIIQAFHLV